MSLSISSLEGSLPSRKGDRLRIMILSMLDRSSLKKKSVLRK